MGVAEDHVACVDPQALHDDALCAQACAAEQPREICAAEIAGPLAVGCGND